MDENTNTPAGAPATDTPTTDAPATEETKTEEGTQTVEGVEMPAPEQPQA